MQMLRTQFYTPSYYPDIPLLDEEFLTLEEGADFSDFSVSQADEFEPAARFD